MSMREWVSEWVSVCVSEWMSEWVSELVNECTLFWLCFCMTCAKSNVHVHCWFMVCTGLIYFIIVLILYTQIQAYKGLKNLWPLGLSCILVLCHQHYMLDAVCLVFYESDQLVSPLVWCPRTICSLFTASERAHVAAATDRHVYTVLHVLMCL